MEDALVVVLWCRDGALAGERSDRGADCSALPRSCPPREAAPRRRVELCPRRADGGGPRAIEALQLRLRPRDGVKGRRDGAASMEAHRSARYRVAVRSAR